MPDGAWTIRDRRGGVPVQVFPVLVDAPGATPWTRSETWVCITRSRLRKAYVSSFCSDGSGSRREVLPSGVRDGSHASMTSLARSTARSTSYRRRQWLSGIPPIPCGAGCRGHRGPGRGRLLSAARCDNLEEPPARNASCPIRPVSRAQASISGRSQSMRDALGPSAAKPRPFAHVLDVRPGFLTVCTRHGICAGRVPLHRDEVEPALVAEHVQLLRNVGALTPGAGTLTFSRGEVIRALRAWTELLPTVQRPRHLGLLSLSTLGRTERDWKGFGPPRSGPNGPQLRPGRRSRRPWAIWP